MKSKVKHISLALLMGISVLAPSGNGNVAFADDGNESNHNSTDDVPQLTGEEAIPEVIDAMTVEEKVSLLIGGNTEAHTEDGEVVGDSGEIPGSAGSTQAIERLGIPSITMADGPLGVSIDPTREDDDDTYYATKFPAPFVLGATWDVDMVNQVADATSDELSAYGIDLLLAPGLNIQSYLLNARNFEYYSEDPELTGELTKSFVNGVEENGIGTTLKHFAAFNQRENNEVDAIISQRALREIYLKGFETTVKEEDPWSIMPSYNQINGTFSSENEDLLTTILRDEWGFNGFAVTDWVSEGDTVDQIKSGTNLIMPGSEEEAQELIDAVNNGDLDESILDRNVEDMLHIIVQTPAFQEHEPSNEPDLNANSEVARQAAADGMVLLENRDDTLPFATDASVSVFGTPQIESMFGGRGSADVNAENEVNIIDGLKNAGITVNEDLSEEYASYIEELRSQEEYEAQDEGEPSFTMPQIPEMDITEEEAAQAAQESDVGIVTIATEHGYYESDRDEEDFYLNDSQKDMVNTVSEAFRAEGKPVVAILNTEGPIETASWEEEVDSILLSWQPGQELGNALADVLTGEVNPSGKLPQTFPVDYSDLPYADRYPGTNDNSEYGEFVYEEGIYVGYRYNTTFDMDPAYEFGYGQSYTDFEYSNIAVDKENFSDQVTVTANVENTGDVAGREVVQAYVSAPDGELEKPALELKSFDKTDELQPGESQTVHFELDAKDIASFDSNESAWIVEEGDYEVSIGASSADLKGTDQFHVDETFTVEEVTDALAPEAEINELSKNEGGDLPDTATNHHFMILSGLGLMLFAGTTLFVTMSRRRSKVKPEK
ncbi:beta-glucosidase [Oceanobacillus locisalsi]|uniref:Beta-glucosidase n=1 Tax=Oceanobacillus locisalsi TaxID=546107 RepID=A0ABW3NH75_9BACI